MFIVSAGHRRHANGRCRQSEHARASTNRRGHMTCSAPDPSSRRRPGQRCPARRRRARPARSPIPRMPGRDQWVRSTLQGAHGHGGWPDRPDVRQPSETRSRFRRLPASCRRTCPASASSAMSTATARSSARSSKPIPDLVDRTSGPRTPGWRSTRSATSWPTTRSANSSIATSTGRSGSRSRSRSSILLIAFGALVAAFVPLVLAITALLAAFGLLGIYSQIVDPVSPYASQLIVLIGLAVAVDYSLFMVTRARREWRRGRTGCRASRSRAAPPGGRSSSAAWR